MHTPNSLTDDSNDDALHHFRHRNPFCLQEDVSGKAATSTLVELS